MIEYISNLKGAVAMKKFVSLLVVCVMILSAVSVVSFASESATDKTASRQEIATMLYRAFAAASFYGKGE